MQSSLYVALSAQVAMEKRLNTIANNVANMNTGGFRADEVKFEENSVACCQGKRVFRVIRAKLRVPPDRPHHQDG